MNLYEKLVELRASVDWFKKDATTSVENKYSSYKGYDYTSGRQILSSIKNKMKELKLLLLPKNILSNGYEKYEYTNSKGKEVTDFIVSGIVTYEWINAENPEEKYTVDIPCFGQQNDVSKAFGSALTYSERYFLLKSLGVPTDDEDPNVKEEEKFTKKNNVVPMQQKSQEKSNGQIVLDIIKDSKVTNDDVKKLVQSMFGENMRVNDLDKKDFTLFIAEVKKKVEGKASE